MVAWVKTGTVNVTLNSATVQGVNTKFVEEFREGDGFVGPDDRLYEVMNLVSQTQMTLGRTYKGPTASAQAYAVVPVQGYLQRTADRLAALTAEAATLVESPTLTALAQAVASANKVARFTGTGTAEMVDAKAFGVQLLGTVDKAAALTALALNIGLGAANDAVAVNFNSEVTPGTLKTTATGSTNGPYNGSGFLQVIGSQTTTRVAQRWTELGGIAAGQTPRTWTRNCLDGTWSAWAQDIKGAVWMPLTLSVSADTLDQAFMTYYVQGSTVTNLPLATTGIIRVLLRGDQGTAQNRCIQEYTPYETANGSSRVWRRTRGDDNVWSTWTRTDGTGKQDAHANLSGLAGVPAAINQIPIFSSGSGAMSSTPAGTAGRALLGAGVASDALNTLGLTRPFMNTVLDTGDFNNITADGWHTNLCNQAMSNSPAGLYTGVPGTGTLPTYWYVHNTVYQNVNNILQVAYPHDNVGHICWRLKVGANWASWNRCLSNNEKTTGSTDVTPGRLLQVGAYGWGSSPSNDISLSGLGYTTTFRSYNDSFSPNLNVFAGINLQREVGGRGMAVAITDSGNKLFWGSRGSPSSAFSWKEGLAVGDYGVGAVNNVIDTADMNVVTAGGLRRFSPTTTNLPSGAQYGGVLDLMYEKSTENWAQLLVSMASPRAWIRSRINNAAPSNAELYTRLNILGTTSQTSGVPTGAIIERGSNANGQYIRFADGTQICWGVVNVSSTNPGANGLGAVTYPVAFATGDVPIPNAHAEPSGNWDHYGFIGTNTSLNTGFYGFVRNGGTGAQTFAMRWSAVGRWFY